MAQSSQAVAEKWKRNMVASVPTIKAGIMAVTSSPMEAAAARADEWVAGVQRAKEAGSYQAGLRAVSLEEWKRLAGEKGTQRITSGVTEATPKVTAFLDQLLPYTEAVKRAIALMPKGGPANSAARMMANFERMSAFKYRKRS